MGNPTVRNLVAVVAGLVLAMVVVMVVEMVGHSIFPPPPDIDLTSPEDQARLMDSIPAAAKAMVVAAWFLGALAGSALAIHLSQRVMPAWIVALVMAALSLWTTQMFPHPLWMVVAALVLPLVAVLAAKRLLAARIVAA